MDKNTGARARRFAYNDHRNDIKLALIDTTDLRLAKPFPNPSGFYSPGSNLHADRSSQPILDLVEIGLSNLQESCVSIYNQRVVGALLIEEQLN